MSLLTHTSSPVGARLVRARSHFILRGRLTPPLALRHCLLTWLLAFASPLLVAQTAPTLEYQVKAVFLFNFVQFIDWPPTAFATPKAPLVIGVLGEDPFGSFLDKTLEGETAGARPLLVRRYRNVSEIETCHILFISRSEASRLPKILSALEGRPILTVADTEGFTALGGMVRFVTEKNKIRLRINVDAAAAAQLQISSKLLRPAEIVSTGKK